MIRLVDPRSARPADPPVAWSRERLLFVVVAALLLALVLAASLVVWLVDLAWTPPADGPGPAGRPVTAEQRRDAIASAPMVSVDPGAAFEAAPAWTPAPPVYLPDADVLRGPAGVPTGFPHTPEGAVAQLAAIDRTVLEAMSLPATAEVYTAWALPGTPPAESWVLAAHVRSFLASARQASMKDAVTVVEVVPVGAMVKGTDGPDWVLACVLYDVRASIRTTSRMGYGRCERMQWSADRWQIAPGVSPADAPSAWPGSQIAKDAGWLTWTPA